VPLIECLMSRFSDSSLHRRGGGLIIHSMVEEPAPVLTPLWCWACGTSFGVHVPPSEPAGGDQRAGDSSSSLSRLLKLTRLRSNCQRQVWRCALHSPCMPPHPGGS
jgi:hypothetical protein